MSLGLVIIGSGAHASKIWRYAELMGLEVQAFVDDDPAATSPSIEIPCLRPIDASKFPPGQPFLVAIGRPDARKFHYEKYMNLGWTPYILIHPSASVAVDAHIGLGTVVCANAVVDSRSVIGVACIVGIGVLIDHDCVVGDYSHLKPGRVLLPYTRVSY
jgi:UDP-3-O-[3-hydroxymyristoyl] glucosamine N-acyltransferase